MVSPSTLQSVSDTSSKLAKTDEGSQSTDVSLSAEGGEKYFDPVTGEQISKNAFKKLQKAPKKEKKDKPAPAATVRGGESAEKKKEKKIKEPEVIFVDETPEGEKIGRAHV